MIDKKTCIELKDTHLLSDTARNFMFKHNMHALAYKTERSEKIIRNKLDPTQTKHHLTCKEAVNWSVLMNDPMIIEAMANSIGMGIHDLNHAPCSTSMQSYIMHTMGVTGNIAIMFDQANQDNVIDPQEASEIIPEVKQAISKLQALLSALEIKKAG